MITLVTCYPYRLGGGENRLLVFCDRADDKTAKNLDLKEKKSFKSITGVVHDIKEAIVDETGHYSISHVIVYYNDLGRVERLLRVVCPVFVVLLGLILLIKRK